VTENLRRQVKRLLVIYGTMFLIVSTGMTVLGALTAWAGLPSWPTYLAFPVYLLVSVPLFTLSERIAARQAKKLEAREKENVLEKLARL